MKMVTLWVVCCIAGFLISQETKLVKQHYTDRLPLVEEVVLQEETKRMYLFFKELCKMQHGVVYVNRYMRCTEDMMDTYRESVNE
jgi:hypothetical protein